MIHGKPIRHKQAVKHLFSRDTIYCPCEVALLQEWWDGDHKRKHLSLFTNMAAPLQEKPFTLIKNT